MDDRPSILHGYAAVTPLDTERITFKAVEIMAALIHDCLVGIETLINEEKRPSLFPNRGVLVSLAIQKLDLDDHVAEQEASATFHASQKYATGIIDGTHADVLRHRAPDIAATPKRYVGCGSGLDRHYAWQMAYAHDR